LLKLGRVVISVGLIVLVLGCGAGLGRLLLSWRESPPKREDESLPPLVDSITIRADEVVERFVGFGSVLADRRAVLAAEVSAVVLERIGKIEAGSKVDKGQPLLRLDDRRHAHELERALALAAADQASLDEIDVQRASIERLKQTALREVQIASDEQSRVTDLFEEGHSHKREFDLVRLAYQQARRLLQNYEKELAVLIPRKEQAAASKRANEAAAAIARLNVERCTIRAPFSGTIDELKVDVGDSVGPGIAVLTMIDSSHVEVPIRLPVSVRGLTGVGSPCRIELQSLAGFSWSGRVARVSPVADQQTRTFTVYAEVDNTGQDNPLVPGAFVRATVDGPAHYGALLVPRGAIRRGRVLVATGGAAEVRKITIKRFIFDQAMVDGDLAGGDQVILSHLDSLTEGARVRVDASSGSTDEPEIPPGELDAESQP